MPTTGRILGTAVIAAVLGISLSACAPEPAETPGPTGSASPSASASASASPTVSPTPSPTETASTLPADCTQIYSPAMLAALQEQNPPLNDPGVTLYSTEQAPLLELLQTAPTLRCSWGRPSEFGLATNVSLVTAAQAATVRETLASSGFACEDAGAATVCRIEQRGVNLDDQEYVRGETQALSSGIWITTSWINFAPDGYTEDILATVVG